MAIGYDPDNGYYWPGSGVYFPTQADAEKYQQLQQQHGWTPAETSLHYGADARGGNVVGSGDNAQLWGNFNGNYQMLGNKGPDMSGQGMGVMGLLLGGAGALMTGGASGLLDGGMPLGWDEGAAYGGNAGGGGMDFSGATIGNAPGITAPNASFQQVGADTGGTGGGTEVATGEDMRMGNAMKAQAASNGTDLSSLWNSNTFSPGLLSGIGSGLGSLASGVLGNKALLGALGGAALGGLSGGSKPAGTITQTQDVPDWLKPYVTANLNAGVNAMGQASQGGNLLAPAQNQLARTINGDYLNPGSNPYFQPYVQDLMGQVGSQFAGTYGGQAGANVNNSGYQEGLARAMTSAALPLYNQAYNNERTNQLTAAGGAPSFAGQSAQATFGPLTQFNGLIPQLRNQSQPYFSNSFGNAAAGALGGYALGKSFGA